MPKLLLGDLWFAVYLGMSVNDRKWQDVFRIVHELYNRLRLCHSRSCPDCHSSLSGIFLEEKSWRSSTSEDRLGQDDRESEGLPTSGSDRGRDGLWRTFIMQESI